MFLLLDGSQRIRAQITTCRGALREIQDTIWVEHPWSAGARRFAAAALILSLIRPHNCLGIAYMSCLNQRAADSTAACQTMA